MLAEGTPAPDFTLPDHDDNPVTLSDLRGKWVVLWWYPKAQTAGCTLESRSFRELAGEFTDLGAEILGASFDTPEENCAFADAEQLGYRLLCDPTMEVGERYETKRAPEEPAPEWPKRRTYLIDPDGIIRKSYRVKDANLHPGEVLEDLRELAGASSRA